MSKCNTTQGEKQFPTEVISLFEQSARVWYKKENFKNNISEKFAEYILENDGIYWLFSIEKITRWKKKDRRRIIKNALSYLVDHEDTQTNDDPNPETHICKELVFASRQNGKEYEHIGTCIDYQTPLRNQRADGPFNSIDLLSYNKDSDTLQLLEMKCKDSDEPLLRAVLEVFTYWKVVDHEKLLYDFKNKLPELSIDPFETQIKKSVLLFEGSPIYNEYVNKESPNTVELMKKLGVGFYGIRETGDGYEVFVP